MLPFEHPDRIQIAFDDHRLVNNAGLLLLDRLAHHYYILEMNGESYHLKRSRENATAQAPDELDNPLRI